MEGQGAAARSRLSSDSSLTSYYTSKEGLESKEEPESVETPTSQKPGYRRAGELPRELRAHCQIFLEEQLYLGAINLLNSMLGAAAAVAVGQGSDRPVPVPPASHLALLNTLTVHPLHTTRAERPEQLEVSSLALGYLRNVLAVVGPVHADLRGAFRFREACGGDSDGDGSEADAGAEPLLGRMSNEGSVWSQGGDFWATVGWAFTCCTKLPQRWRYWKAWLEFMLDALEADWAERERLDEEETENSTRWRREALMAMYMAQDRPKVVVRALLAYGDGPAFREVFEKEHRGPPRARTGPGAKRKREQELDLDKDRFGDYGNDEECFSSGISEPPTPHKPRAEHQQHQHSQQQQHQHQHAGMVEAAPLRLRLFRLVSAVVFALRPRAELGRLYEDLASSVKLLPVDAFALLVTQRPNPLLAETHVTLTRELFHSLLPSTYRDPGRVDAEADRVGSLTGRMLEHCYVGHPANSVGVEDNAKLSLVVESAVQLLWACDMLECSEGFAAAVRRGIEARESKAKRKSAKGKGRGKGDSADGGAAEVLRASSERLRVLLDVLQAE